MVLLSLLCAIALQYYRPSWRMSLHAWLYYHDWLLATAKSFVEQSKLTRAVVLIVPLWLVVVIVLSLVQTIFGPVSRFLIDVFMAWAVLDVRPLFSKGSDMSLEDLLAQSVYRVFTPVFWFAIAGWPALFLYLIVWRCHQHEDVVPDAANEQEVAEQLRSYPVAVFLSLLVWVPMRLMMISGALVGGLAVLRRVIADGLRLGLSLSVTPLAECFYPQSSLGDKVTLEHRHVLVYAMAIWLAVMLIFFLGALTG